MGGCFGPVGSLERCKSLYEGCGSGYDTFKYDAGNGRVEEIAYDNWCPCYQQASDTGVCAQTPGPTPPGPGPATPSPGTPEAPARPRRRRTATASPGLQTAPGTACGRKSNAPPRGRTGPTARASCSISGRRRCARRRGANGSSREKGKGPARPPEGVSCGSPRAESSPGGP